MQRAKSIIAIPLAFYALTLNAQIEKQKPNVIFILTDDQGYGDLSCTGNRWIKTPEMDKLHSEGVRFTNFHSGTTSAPTRASLMTGKHFDRVGVWHTIMGRSLLKPGEKTLADRLKESGYSTAIFGKWHLGDNYPFRPQDRGLDESLVLLGGGVGQAPDFWGNDYFDDTYTRNGKPEKQQGYCTDVWFSEALRFIENQKSQPFFCYIATNAPHGPYNVDPKYSQQYTNNQLIPNKEFYGMISNIDENIGRLRNELVKLGIADNTILIFMTDNGTAAGVNTDNQGFVNMGYGAGMRGKKGSEYEGGHRVPFFVYWKNGGIVGGKDEERLAFAPDVTPTILDLCGIKINAEDQYDGVSLKPLLRDNPAEWPDRLLIVDTQRDEKMKKWKKSAVMSQQWRLINGSELYQIGCDTEQRTNVASKYPQVVSRMRNAYETWWKGIEPSNKEVYSILLGTEHENPVRLSSHDLHTDGDNPAWSQDMVREGIGPIGNWMVDVAEAGEYEFKVMRWPSGSALPMRSEAPEGNVLPNGKIAYKKGNALDINSATIQFGKTKETKAVQNSRQQSVVFRLKLDKGKNSLWTSFADRQGKEYSAYYVEVKRL
jgi:arylsulfatase A-like enzyme